MANGSPTRPRTSGVFSGLLLIVFGFLLLLHNYGHLHLGGLFRHWWPLIFIFWGATKLYERTLAQRQGRTAGWITPGEVFLVIGLMVVVGIVVAVEEFPRQFPGMELNLGEPYSFPLDLNPQTIAPNAHILIHAGRGTITVRSSDEPTLRITGQKSIRTFSESDANKRSSSINIQTVKNGDSHEIHPTGFDLGDSRISVDMDVVVPKKSVVTVRNDRGGHVGNRDAAAVVTHGDDRFFGDDHVHIDRNTGVAEIEAGRMNFVRVAILHGLDVDGGGALVGV